MIDSLADAGWLAEIGALDGPSAGVPVPDAADALTATLFVDDPDAVRTAIGAGAHADGPVAGTVDDIAAHVLSHLAR